MLRKLTSSFALAIYNIRSHFFHTLLSVLGIVIGVASLVAILSLIDGLEDFARKQITETTSLKAIVVKSDPYKRSNDIRIRKDTFAIIRYSDLSRLSLSKPADIYLYRMWTDEVLIRDTTLATRILATGKAIGSGITVSYGKAFSDRDMDNKRQVALINESFLKIAWPGSDPQKILGHILQIDDRTLTIKGIISDEKLKGPHVVFPITLLTDRELYANSPDLIIEADLVEHVPLLKEELERYVNENYSSQSHELVIQTNEMRVNQATKGFLLFRIVMGLIVGISVLVGGIGVMNVLLISVTERTVEIGIRKAVGANRMDIILQFLSESVTVSAFGSMVGLILGVLGTMAFIPVIRALTDIPFYSVYTWNTFSVIGILALLVGVIFGTYPAIRASRLDPVEAIRRE